MTPLSRKIAAALDAHAGTAGRVDAEAAGHRLALLLTASGPVGLSFDALEYAAPEAGARTTDSLRAWADRLAARVTYLMEPLVLVEIDPAAGEAELRSQSPTAHGDLKSFYEVRLDRLGSLRLARVVFDEETRRRRPAPCHLTREALERLTDDLVACAG